MTVKISAPTSPADPTFARVLAAIPQGDQWAHGTILPYTGDGLRGETQLLLEATPNGGLVEIYVNGRLITRVEPDTMTSIVNLALVRGVNDILVKQGYDTFQTRIWAMNYAVFMEAFSDETYVSVESATDDNGIEVYEQHFRSFFSTRLTEHQVLFSDLLPSTIAYRTLLGKIAVRSLINESSSTRGVEDILTSATTKASACRAKALLPASTNVEIPNPVYTDARDFGGYTFHYWLPNTCAASWHGFVRLIDTMLDDVQLFPLSTSEAKVSIRHEGTEYDLYFNTESAECTNLDDECAVDSHIWVRITSFLPIYICPWSHGFDVGVTRPLGRMRFDQNIPWDLGIPLDSVEETAPPDGWDGLVISEFDEPRCLDSTVGGGVATSLETLCCGGPITALLVETLETLYVGVPQFVSATLTVSPAPIPPGLILFGGDPLVIDGDYVLA